ncbi:MAG: hypothetical protein Q7N50_11225 [Armatimonadota bacterium]|nr:hypothetical protein [Armatimonadota bacterium]
MNGSKMPVIQAKRLAYLARRLMLNVYLLEGEYEGSPLRLLVADDGSTLSYILSLAFPEGAAVSSLGRISAFKAPELAGSDADIIVVGANQLLVRRYEQRGFHIVPKYVRLFLSMSDHPDVMISRLKRSAKENVRRNLRRMTAAGLGYELQTAPPWFDLFYHEMYRPYIGLKFGESADIYSYRYLKREFSKGGVLVININGEPVAGTLVYMEGSMMRIPFSGVMRGREDLVRQGVVTALYYYGMLLGHSWGCSVINFGHSRPFLSDGVLKYKLRWGMTVEDDDDGRSSFAIMAPGWTVQAAKFISSHRFFYRQNGGIELLADPCLAESGNLPESTKSIGQVESG